MYEKGVDHHRKHRALTDIHNKVLVSPIDTSEPPGARTTAD
jgi:hypothetical protein